MDMTEIHNMTHRELIDKIIRMGVQMDGMERKIVTLTELLESNDEYEDDDGYSEGLTLNGM